MSSEVVPRPFPSRAEDAHKGDVGRIVVIGGRCDDKVMVGAPTLAADAAFRTGAGLVRIVVPPEAALAIGSLSPCSTVAVLPPGEELKLVEFALDFRADVVAVGPGLSPRIGVRDLLDLFERFPGTIVADADALNTLSESSAWQAPVGERVILTPHPGEMRRLLIGLGESPVADRVAAARLLANRTRTIVVHKGAGTVVSDGTRVFTNPTGNAGMATAGAGDVLTGVIAALAGQGLQPFDAAVLGVYLHGSAGDLAADRLGFASVTALDVLAHLSDAIRAHQAAA